MAARTSTIGARALAGRPLTHIYVDPAGPHYRPPNLISELTRFRSTKAVIPEENQMTAALAWLLDHSLVFARSFVRLFFDHECLERVTAFGTELQVSLPNPNGGWLYPDLAVTGDRRLFELLVEVKVGSEPHSYPDGDQLLLQPDMYLSAWRGRPESTQAEIRRVGTLTKDFPFPPQQDEWRARDVTWEQVRDELRQLIDGAALETGVVPVARDLSAVIGSVVLREPQVSQEHQDALLEDGLVLLGRVRQLLAEIGKPEKPGRYADYVGLYVRRPDEFQLWIFVTPIGGRYNRFGNPDVVGIQLLEDWQRRFPDEARARAGGFERMRDLGGDSDDRIYIDLETIDGRVADPNGVAEQVAVQVVTALRACDPPLI